MKSCVFFAILFQCLCSYAAENLRYFTSVDSPNTKLTLLEMDLGDKPVALLKLEGIKHNDAGKVFMFEGEKNKRFMPMNGATNMVLIDYDKKTLISGTVKKVWTLAGLDKDILLEEVTAPATVTAESIKADYDKTEGAGSYGTDSAQITKAAESIVNTKCGTKMTMASDASSFKNSGMAEYKSVAVANAIAELCADADYLSVLKAVKSVSLTATSQKDLKIEKKGATLLMQLPKDIQNTARTVKKNLEKKL